MKKQTINILLCLLTVAMGADAQIMSFMSGDSYFRYVGENTSHQVIDSIDLEGTLPDGLRFTATTLKKKRDALGNVTEEVFYVCNPQMRIVPSVRRTNHFDTDGRLEYSYFARWDEKLKQYHEFQRYSYRYSGDDACLLNRYVLNTIDQWILKDSLRISVTYNERLDPVEILTQHHLGTEWKDTLRESIHYDSIGRLTKRELFEWKGLSWKYRSMDTYLYKQFTDSDNTAYVNEMIWDGFCWRQPIYTFAGKQIDGRKTVFLSKLTHSIPIPPKERNEAKNAKDKGFYINSGKTSAKITVINTHGKRLFSKRIRGTAFIPLSDYGKGTYTLRIEQNGRVATRKIRVN
ncbi:MAG: T9SS type A sorting domain-containing protein [Paludibacteraceae bacterium]|nr:T9SS type A sorting domain-containing protein [Paludibacteraceae bacterium]